MKQRQNSGITKKNLIILLIAIVLITIGYIIMEQGDAVISPIILIISYVIIIPVALLFPTKK